MNVFDQNLGCLTPETARPLAEYLNRNPWQGTDELRGSVQRALEPERQYQDLAVYAMPGYVPGWQA